jgi:NhaA family Na+:H+ antiporter
VQNKILAFIKLESFSGIVLFFSAMVGLLLANSPCKEIYNTLLIKHHLYIIINDGLMTLFFLLVGIEIRREFVEGEINTLKKIALPLVAAFFGMVVPTAIYLLINFQHRELWQGWAIPSATDIAFALGVLTLLRKRIPLSVKSLLMMIAIFDDIGAIIIIAFYYAHQLLWIYLIPSCVLLMILKMLNYYKVEKLSVYFLLGILLWFCVLKSGIHPTITGVLLAFVLPIKKIQHCENILHPWTVYLILPLFAIANTGIPLIGGASLNLSSSLSLGIILGLFLGKQLGIFSAILCSVKLGFAKLPSHTNYRMMYGMSLLCGIGFTMSLFIGGLAFDNNLALSSLIHTIRASVVLGSLISGVMGYLFLRFLA